MPDEAATAPPAGPDASPNELLATPAPSSALPAPAVLLAAPGTDLALRAPPPPAPSPSIAHLIVVTVVSLAADLASKGWAKATLSGFDTKIKGVRRIAVIKDHMDFIFAQNPGGAWSFLRSLPDTLRRPFFLVVSAAAIVFIVSIYQRIQPEQRAMKWGLPLALGGAMGNLVDRIRYGWVIDFVDVYLVQGGRERHWPTFNVADIAIVVGVALMAIEMLFLSGKPAKLGDLKGEAPSAVVPPAA